MAHIDVPVGNGLERLRLWEMAPHFGAGVDDAKGHVRGVVSSCSRQGGCTHEDRADQSMSHMTRHSSCIGDAAGAHRGDVLTCPRVR